MTPQSSGRTRAQLTTTAGMGVFGGVGLVLATGGSWILSLWDLAGPPIAPELVVALSSLLLVFGIGSFLLVGGSRRLLTPLWAPLVFLLEFSVFHFGTLGEPPVQGWYNPKLFHTAWAICVVALLAFLCGYLVTRGRTKIEQTGHTLSVLGAKLDRQGMSVLIRLGTALFLIGLLLQFGVVMAIGPGKFVQLGYNHLKTALHATSGRLGYVMMLGQMCAMVGMLVHVTMSAMQESRLFRSYLMAGTVACYLVVLVVLGDRSEMALVLFVLLFCYHYFVRPFRWGQALILFSVVMVVFTGIKVYRGTRDTTNILQRTTSVERMVDKNSAELGYTLETTIRAMDLVPRRFEPFYGSTYVSAVARAVPNVTFTKREWGFVSSVWINEATKAKKNVGKGGIAFSIVAEAYINFVYLGPPLVLFVFGMMHGFFETWLAGKRVEVFRALLYMILQIGLLNHIRNTVVVYIRGSIWLASLLFLLVIVLRIYMLGRQRRQGTAAPGD